MISHNGKECEKECVCVCVCVCVCTYTCITESFTVQQKLAQHCK